MGEDAEQLDHDRLGFIPGSGLQGADALEEIVAIGGRTLRLPDGGLAQQTVDLLVTEDAPQLFQDFFQRPVVFHRPL